MNQQSEKHTSWKKWGKRLLLLVLGMLILLLFVRLSLTTSPVQNWVRSALVDTANKQLNGRLTVEKLSGDLWKEAEISGVSLQQRKDTLMNIDSVYIAYNIWALAGGRLDISKLEIQRPSLYLRQRDGRWNVERLVDAPAETASPGKEGDMVDFQIADLRLARGSLSLESDSLLNGTDVTVADLSVSSSLGYREGNVNLNLAELSFEVRRSRLGQPLRVETSASAGENKITLEKLLMATGRSVVRSSAFASTRDSSLQLDLSASPLAWRDLADYAEQMPLRRDVSLEIGLQGKPADFDLSVNLRAEGLDTLQIRSRMQWDQSLVLREVSADMRNLEPARLFADSSLPSVRTLSAEFSGRIDLEDYRRGSGKLDLSIDGIQRNHHSLDEVTASARLEGSTARLRIRAESRRQSLLAEVDIEELWADLPAFSATLRASEIDPAYWMQDTTYAGNLSFQSTLSGRGFIPGEQPWKYSLEMDSSRLMERQIDRLSLDGTVSSSRADLSGKLSARKGMLELEADAENLEATPIYSYTLRSRDLDVAALMGIPDFETAFNTEIRGEGSGTTMDALRLNTSISVDSSLVNGELIRNFSADLSIRDTVANIRNGRLESSIARGAFDGRLHLLRPYDAHNELSLNLRFKDVSALAPLAKVEQLGLEGDITGKLSPVEQNNLQFTGAFDFSRIRYGELFSADQADGSIDTRIRENLEFMADIDMSAPTFSGVKIQDLSLRTQGVYSAPNIDGSFNLQFSSPNEGRIEQVANYSVNADSVLLRTTEFNIISDYRMLSLESPFDLGVRGDTLRMEPMRVSSGDGAYLQMSIPILSEQEQRLSIDGNALNTAVIQSSILGETFFNGMLSGRLDVARKDTSLHADGRLLLSEVTYKESSFDSLIVEGTIADERLHGTLALRHEGERLVSGETSLPFKLGDPENFSTDFFREPVSGVLRVRGISVERFKSFFAEAGVMNTTGIFSFRGSLDGQAGNPDFNADVKLSNATLSGVAVDSVTAGLDYDHDRSALELDASVVSLRQKAATISARMPFFIDMKTFRVDLPQPEDSISADIHTNDFNLAALNDFVNRQTVRGINGQLNGNLRLEGKLGDLQTKGQLELRKGGFRLVPAGIGISGISSRLQFDPGHMRLAEFSAESGKGQLTASGTVALEKMTPGNIDLRAKARNFRIANTSRYNAVINMDTRADGSFSQPKVTGNVSFISGFVTLDNFGEKSVEHVELDQQEEQGTEFSAYDSLALDMDVSFNRRFFIRNQRYLEMEIELEGALDLLKDRGKDLQLFGSMSAASGYARPFGKQFDLQEGTVTFSGDPTNPRLMIRTQYEPPQTQEEIMIWYIVEGTVENPKFKYESEPPMELENIISYTLFGQPFYALDSWKQVVAGSGNTSATNVALDVLLDRVEALATQQLGIDVVKIDNTQIGGETGTSITTGWYLNPRVFFAIQNVITGSTPDTSFLLEYLLRKNLKLMIRQGNGIRQGVDIKWNYDY